MAKFYASKDSALSLREQTNMERARAIAAQGMVLLKNEGALPLDNQVKTLAAFGVGIRHTVKGGTGSGDVNSRMVVNVEQGLIEAGYTLTSTAWLDRYDALCEETWNTYTADIKKKIAAAGKNAFMTLFQNPYRKPAELEITPEELGDRADAALYVISRNSGEGADRHPVAGDYELLPEEEKNLRTLATVYDNIIVALNVGGVIDTKFLRSCPQIKAILLMSQAGNISGHALADILSGKVTPSGHLTTTWAENYTDYPCAASFSHMNGNLDDEYYNEGIYVGYRYFDTFGVNPAYPFGYGLSYTDFSLQCSGVSLNGDTITVTAAIRNTGDTYSGRAVAQIYASAPKGSLDKPWQILTGFAKTGLLSPGQEETVTISFPASAMASYCEKHAEYVLEPGKYVIRLGVHSRNTHVAAILEVPRRIVTAALKNKVQPDVTLDLLSPEGRIPFGYDGEQQEIAAAPVLSLNPADIRTETVVYSDMPQELTTDKDWIITLDDVLSGKAGLSELVAQLTDEELTTMAVGIARVHSPEGQAIIGAASNSVPGAAGETSSILLESRGIPNLVLADGPAGLRLQATFVTDSSGNVIPGLSSASFFGEELLGKPVPERPADAVNYYQYCTAIPIATLLAQTWDMAVVEAAGDIVGGEMEEFGVHLWLAPGMNIHRNPLCGRNFEYYSEDPLIAGRCAAADTRGVQKHPGCGTTIKHFCLNNSEDNRYHINCHCSERALREIYLKGFEIAVREAQPLSLMSSYNLVNGEHAANKYDTLTSILRDEWGFKGLVMTDWATTSPMSEEEDFYKYPFSDPAGCIAAGNDLIEPGNEWDVETILRSLGAKAGDRNVLYPITRAQLQQCVLRILTIIAKIVRDQRA